MGFSKKKLLSKKKAEKRVGPKAKEKAKKAKQIRASNAIKASKRKATALKAGGRGRDRPGGSKGADDADLDGLDAVDRLFASADFAEDGDEDGEAQENFADREEASEGEESSAGAFVDDIEDDDDGLPIGQLEGLDNLSAGARHEAELKAIKEKDPQFYQFLVENDRALLDFRAPPEEEQEAKDADGAPKEDDEEAEEAPAAAPPAAGSVLTIDRFARLRESASKSWTAFKATMTCYNLAVRSIQERQEAQEAEEAAEEEEEHRKSGKRGRRQRNKKKSKARFRLMTIEDEATFSEVLEWSIVNIPALLVAHAGELQDGDGSRRRQRGRRSGKHGAVDEDRIKMATDAGAVVPSRYSKWLRVKVLAVIFFEETFFLLNRLNEPRMIEYVLRTCSKPEVLSWLWPFQQLRHRYLKRCCSLWSTASSHQVRLLAFLFIRNSATMSLHVPESAADKKSWKEMKVPQLELLIRMLLKGFADAAALGYSWRSLSTFRFMENCLVELLRLGDEIAYRIGYACIRQLALILRTSCIATAKLSRAQGKKKGIESQAKSLVSWPFVRSMSLWTKAVGSVPSLKPLAYPLFMIILGAVKNKLGSTQHYPFVHHCLRCLCRLASSLEVFIPVASHLLKALTMLVQAMDKAAHKRRLKNHSQNEEGAEGGDSAPRAKGQAKEEAPDLEVLLRLSDGQLQELPALEAVGSGICLLFVDHLGLLSRSPSYPEIAVPVLMHLKKCSKHCRSEPLRRQLKSLQTAAEASIEEVRAQRETLTEAPSWKRFLLFEPKTPMARAREVALQRRAQEEKAFVEAEMRSAAQPNKKKPKELDDFLGPDSEKAERKDAKREAQRLKRKAEGESKKHRMEKRAKKLALEAANKAETATGGEAPLTGPAIEDAVEEMVFAE